MAKLTATPDIIVVDKSIGAVIGATTIAYSKPGRFEDLFERTGSSSYQRVNVHLKTGLGDEADDSGSYTQTLMPGQIYQLTAFTADHGPFDTDPIQLGTLLVYCIWKAPTAVSLITDQNSDTGGTWHWHQIHTKIPTNMVAIGVSQTKPVFDADGIPRLTHTEGVSTTPLSFTNDHRHEMTPIVPGHHYFFVAVVTDTFGNWNFVIAEFDTKLRKVGVSFTEMIIYDDGDDGLSGEGEFWFDVHEAKDLVVSYHQPTMTIDDWSGTGRPYAISYGPYVIGPKGVDPEKAWIGVYSHAVEHDGWFEVDDKAATLFGPRDLPIPHGRFTEVVPNETMFVDCQPTSGSLHYSVKVEFSVNYV
jgi:hypothetical protein